MGIEERLTYLLEETSTTSAYAKIDPKDPYIGRTMDGVRKTEGGWVWVDPETKESFWYYQKYYETRDTKGRLVKKDGPYWYKKRSIPDEDGEEGRRIEEVYVGKSLPFKIPKRLRGGLIFRDENDRMQTTPTPEVPKEAADAGFARRLHESLQRL